MRQPIEDDATRPAWEDVEPEPDDEALRPPEDDVVEAVKEAPAEFAEEVYERTMTPPPETVEELDRGAGQP